MTPSTRLILPPSQHINYSKDKKNTRTNIPIGSVEPVEILSFSVNMHASFFMSYKISLTAAVSTSSPNNTGVQYKIYFDEVIKHYLSTPATTGTHTVGFEAPLHAKKHAGAPIAIRITAEKTSAGIHGDIHAHGHGYFEYTTISNGSKPIS